ncbi:hypothetical protein K9M79_07180 [Candidatus Woesearchaeota archaeon]|nr:hypothetical protein [Candidatus Woesearchaeota archaeon]
MRFIIGIILSVLMSATVLASCPVTFDCPTCQIKESLDCNNGLTQYKESHNPVDMVQIKESYPCSYDLVQYKQSYTDILELPCEKKSFEYVPRLKQIKESYADSPDMAQMKNSYYCSQYGIC